MLLFWTHQFHGMKALLSCQNFHLFPPHSKHAALENDQGTLYFAFHQIQEDTV